MRTKSIVRDRLAWKRRLGHVIAAEVKKSDNVLVLRDYAGIPAWSGWRR